MNSYFNSLQIGGLIKFKIFPKIWEGERCKFGEVFDKMSKLYVFDISWDILSKVKGNLGQNV